MHLALQDGDYTALHDLADANRKMVRGYGTEFGAVLRLIADPASHPVVFHCIGGKDRTGIAAALLLFTLGVPWDDVRRDYLRSNDRLQGVVEDQIAGLTGSPNTPARPRPNEENLAALRRFFIVESSYIDAGRDEAERLAGSLEQYIRDHLGVSNEMQASLRSTLLEPATA
jgi:protein-tyrosine phosphatase